MVSIIVPVYKAENYIAKCIESILAQTYKDIELILVDDGSPDSSGKICDEFAQRDSRVRVFHVQNGGAASARNYGLDIAKGDYIGFVDNDDWLEPDMYEILVDKAGETGCDIVECGSFAEYPDHTVERRTQEKTYEEDEAIKALIWGKIDDTVYNKLWKKEIFSTERFMTGRQYEDVAIVYKLIAGRKVVGIDKLLYHAAQRGQSVSHSHNIKNLTDFWRSHKESYEGIMKSTKLDPETEKRLLQRCAIAIARTWAWYKDNYGEERQTVTEMKEFACSEFPVFGFGSWPVSLRLGVFLSRFDNKLSFNISYAINKLNRKLRSKQLY